METRGQHGPGGSLSLLGESRVATNIRGFFATRIGSALPDTGEFRNKECILYTEIAEIKKKRILRNAEEQLPLL